MHTNSNLEIELKLHVPDTSVAGVEKALARGKVNRVELRALYFDTIDRQLALQQVSLRLRLENNRWVQTIKIKTSSFLTRIEYNHFRPHPELDLDLYKNTVAEKFISQLKSTLNIRYETFVQRHYRNTRKSSNLVEIAFDRGYIRSGNQELKWTPDLRQQFKWDTVTRNGVNHDRDKKAQRTPAGVQSQGGA